MWCECDTHNWFLQFVFVFYLPVWEVALNSGYFKQELLCWLFVWEMATKRYVKHESVCYLPIGEVALKSI